MFDRKDNDRRPQEEGEAGEEFGTGSGHCLQISNQPSEVKRGTYFRALPSRPASLLVIVLGYTGTSPAQSLATF